MRKQERELTDATRFFALGALLLLMVVLTPDAGQMAHKSFFAVARDSAWSRPLDWAAVWCSAKIILLSISIFLVLDALLSLMIRAEHQTACVVVFVLATVPVLLGFFGVYELVKAVF